MNTPWLKFLSLKRDIIQFVCLLRSKCFLVGPCDYCRNRSGDEGHRDNSFFVPAIQNHVLCEQPSEGWRALSRELTHSVVVCSNMCVVLQRFQTQVLVILSFSVPGFCFAPCAPFSSFSPLLSHASSVPRFSAHCFQS